MLKCLNKYFEKKQEKEKDIRQLYEKNRSNILKTEQELKKAMQGGELDRVVELTNELDDLKSQTGYIEKMKREIELSRTFPYGAIKKEWDDICNRNMDDWISIIRRIYLCVSNCNILLRTDKISNGSIRLQRHINLQPFMEDLSYNRQILGKKSFLFNHRSNSHPDS